MADAENLRIPFSLRGIGGLIAVSVICNTDPDALGYSLLTGGLPTDPARGFPVCRATVTYPAEGYAAMFGWTQMVRSTDSAPDRFEMDPIALYQQIPTPYAWFGVRPELFDAPARATRYYMAWEAHSFLCVSPDAVITRHVQAITGFSWGFTVNGQDISFARPAPLEPEAWDSHLGLLRTDYPNWVFDSGYLPGLPAASPGLIARPPTTRPGFIGPSRQGEIGPGLQAIPLIAWTYRIPREETCTT